MTDRGSWKRRYTLRPIRRLTAPRLGFALASALLATALTHLLLPLLAPNVFLMFLLAVLGSSLHGGLWAGLLSVVLVCLGAAIVVFEPVGLPVVHSPLDLGRIALLATFGSLIAVLAQMLRAARARVEEREQIARVGEESFRAIFNSTADAIYVAGPLGELLNVNNAALELQGYRREEMQGRSWQSFMDPALNDMSAMRALVERAFLGEPLSYEAWLLRKSGPSIPVEVRLSAARYFGRDVIIAIARDLTERRRLEAQLRQSQKMDAIGRLAGGVAHDFNNLLTSIRGYASLMRDRVSHDPTLVEDLGEIERAVELASVVTGQLLAFSRKQETVARAVSLNDALDQTESLLRRLLDERVELVVDRGPRLGLSTLDVGQFEQVVMNLVVNARDAIRAKGRIVIRTRNVDAGSPPSPHVALSVTDDGVGMDEALRARIFEPFFTTKETGHGTGLGLSTVYGIVQQSGGRVEVESTPGAGSTFTIYFPRVDEEVTEPLRHTGDAAAPAIAPAAPSAHSPAASSPDAPSAASTAASTGDAPRAAEPHSGAAPNARRATILLAEDETPVRHLVRRLLVRRGYHVLDAGNGREALDVARAHVGSIDALVTDVIMPEMTGPELAEALREKQPELPVLFTSGYNDQGMDGNGVVEGLGIAFLQKPFLPDDLLGLVAELLEQADARQVALSERDPIFDGDVPAA